MIKRKIRILACIMTALTFSFTLTGCGNGNTSMRYNKKQLERAKRNNPVKNNLDKVPSKTGNLIKKTNIKTTPTSPGTGKKLGADIGAGMGANMGNNAGAAALLIKIQSNCDDILKDVNQGNWTSCKKRVRTINTCNKSLQPQMGTSLIGGTGSNAGLSRAIADLNSAVGKKDAMLAKLRANEVAKHISKISKKSPNHTASELSTLKSTVSCIPTYADAKNLKAAKTNCKNAQREWMALKKKLHPTYKEDSNKMDALIAKLTAASNTGRPVQIKTCAKAVSDQMAVIEGDLLKQATNK